MSSSIGGKTRNNGTLRKRKNCMGWISMAATRTFSMNSCWWITPVYCHSNKEEGVTGGLVWLTARRSRSFQINFAYCCDFCQIVFKENVNTLNFGQRKGQIKPVDSLLMRLEVFLFEILLLVLKRRGEIEVGWSALAIQSPFLKYFHPLRPVAIELLPFL